MSWTEVIAGLLVGFILYIVAAWLALTVTRVLVSANGEDDARQTPETNEEAEGPLR